MQCPNCGAQVPAGDIFCGECGSRVVPEEKPTPTPPSPPDVSPPIARPKRGLPKGLLIGCGGLLALAVIAGCIFGMVTLFGGPSSTPTPTQVIQKPTNTPMPVPTATAMPSPKPILSGAGPAFELVTFAQDVTEDDEPIDPGATFPAGVTKVYALFEFTGMQDGVVYDAFWYRDGQEELHKTWEWSLGEEGRSWVNIFNDEGLTSGNYELEVFVGDQLLLNEKFIIQSSFARTVTNVRFALIESNDDLPVGIGDVFPYGITEVYVFFDYQGFGDVEEIESTWLRDGETDASGTLDWLGEDSGTYRVRFFDDEPLAAGHFEWQLRLAGEDLAYGSFHIKEPLLFEDFGDPSGGWLEGTDDDGAQGYRDGSYYISVSVPDLIVWDNRGHSFDDFTLELDAWQTGGNEVNSYGVLFRYVDNENFYRFDVSSDGFFSLSKLEGGEWLTLQDWEESPHINPMGELNHLKVISQGDQIAIFVNDQELTSVLDGSFSGGDVGIFASTFDVPDVEAVFDNLWVMAYP